MTGLSTQEFESIASVMRRIATDIILPVYDDSTPVLSRDKGNDDRNPVTKADVDAEQALTEFLRKNWPNATIIGEEVVGMNYQIMTELQKDKGMVWVLDPIDGTTNFKNKDPNFGIMVACVIDGVTQYAWIYCPRIYGGVLLSATRGKGTYADYDNGKRQRVFAKQLPFDQIAMGHYALYQDFTYDEPGYALIDATLSQHTRYKHISMAAETVRMVLDGDIGIVYIQPKLWDRIPPALVLSEAAGVAAPLSHLDGNLYKYDTTDTPVVFAASHKAAKALKTLFLGQVVSPASPSNPERNRTGQNRVNFANDV